MARPSGPNAGAPVPCRVQQPKSFPENKRGMELTGPCLSRTEGCNHLPGVSLIHPPRTTTHSEGTGIAEALSRENPRDQRADMGCGQAGQCA